MRKFKLVSKALKEMNVSASINAYESLPTKKKDKELFREPYPNEEEIEEKEE